MPDEINPEEIIGFPLHHIGSLIKVPLQLNTSGFSISAYILNRMRILSTRVVQMIRPPVPRPFCQDNAQPAGRSETGISILHRQISTGELLDSGLLGAVNVSILWVPSQSIN